MVMSIGIRSPIIGSAKVQTVFGAFFYFYSEPTLPFLNFLLVYFQAICPLHGKPSPGTDLPPKFATRHGADSSASKGLGCQLYPLQGLCEEAVWVPSRGLYASVPPRTL